MTIIIKETLIRTKLLINYDKPVRRSLAPVLTSAVWNILADFSAETKWPDETVNWFSFQSHDRTEVTFFCFCCFVFFFIIGVFGGHVRRPLRREFEPRQTSVSVLPWEDGDEPPPAGVGGRVPNTQTIIVQWDFDRYLTLGKLPILL